ncbi:MAG: endonuclease domain-containing protein [Candidatus Erginobacter occultus]|nr:endonuclease domain-containing protein [Candidatus Erginobacter occultus]
MAVGSFSGGERGISGWEVLRRREGDLGGGVQPPWNPLPLGGEGRVRGTGNEQMKSSGHTRNLARKLRREQTETEARLWKYLRDRRLKGVKFRRQYPIGKYILDFYCPEARLAVELDGGGHNRPEQRKHDDKRDQEIRGQGIKRLRFWDNDVWRNLDGVLKKIWDELPERRTDHLTDTPHP